MKSSLIKIVLAVVFLPVLAAGQTSVPGKAPRAGTPTASSPQTAAPAMASRPSPSPTPTPPRPNPALAQAPITNGPRYSPSQLDFGSVGLYSSAARTFSLTPPVSGEITLEFPVGPFLLAELRRVPPFILGQGKSQRAVMPPGKPTPLTTVGQTQIYKWNFAAGEEMQLVIMFFPIYSNKNPALRTTSMKLSGPGAITTWNVTIPMHGTVASSKLDLTPQLIPPTIGADHWLNARSLIRRSFRALS
jgi:hypothetical protein